ncbi:hypothetical protein ABZZ74_23610 [Streptomyces sp. NPDC006476]|uniref:hypothetical protein n=1 Tax=Streptomyces sp. NPDC006476 TaxID=3157175 RepID=UPI0033A66965
MTTAAKRRQAIPAEAFEHGDARRYRRGCTCQPCTTGATTEARRWKYLRDTGRGGITPAEKLIAHIWQLRAAGMTDQEICNTAELSPPHLYQIIRCGGTVRHFTASRILGIPVPASDGPSRNGAQVPILGTRRRLQTLNAEGWPCKELDRRLDTGTGYTAYLLRAAGETVRLSTADNIRFTYRQLSGRLPEEHGVTAVNAKQTRARAAAKGWARAAYWDEGDFDNPAFTPVTEIDFKRDDVAALRREEIIHFAWHGDTPEQILARLNGEVSISTVRQIVTEWRTGEKRQRKAVATTEPAVDAELAA